MAWRWKASFFPWTSAVTVDANVLTVKSVDATDAIQAAAAAAITAAAIPAGVVTALGTGATLTACLTATGFATPANILYAAMTQSYAADGAEPTLAQAVYLVMQSLHEFSITGTTRTVKKLDGSTTAATFTLDSATAPTSTTRAT